MQDEIHRTINVDVIGYIVMEELKTAVVKMGDVVDASGGQIIDADNFVSLSKQSIHQVRTQKASAAGENNAQ
jgi:hypothetical protein